MAENPPDSPQVPLPPGERTRWLMQYEPWLRVLAQHEIHQRLASKFDPSDVVQQTMLAAWQAWDRMDAQDEAQRLAWLRKILAHQLAKLVRHFEGAQKRDIAREASLQQALDRSAARLDDLLPARSIAQSGRHGHRAASLLAKVLSELPEDYREVILLRNLEDLPHAEVAQRMGRSEAAVRMLWLRPPIAKCCPRQVVRRVLNSAPDWILTVPFGRYSRRERKTQNASTKAVAVVNNRPSITLNRRCPKYLKLRLKRSMTRPTRTPVPMNPAHTPIPRRPCNAYLKDKTPTIAPEMPPRIVKSNAPRVLLGLRSGYSDVCLAAICRATSRLL